MMKIKNVVIINDFNFVQGGASKVAVDTAKILKSYGINVYFFYAVNNEKAKIKGVNYICTNQNEALKEKNKVKGFVNGLYNLKAKKELTKMLKKLNPDETIIHVHSWTKALSSSIFSAIFKMKFKMVLTLHDYFTACPNGGFFNYKSNSICYFKPLSLKCLKCNCDSRSRIFKIYRILRHFIQYKIVKLNKKLENAIVISNFSQNILTKYFSKEINICNIYNPIDIKTLFDEDDNDKEDFFLFVGRIDKEKGIEDFCEIISKTKEKGIVVGDGKMKEQLEKRYKEIEFTGWKNSQEVYGYMKKAKALIFTSLWYETAGLTVLEAQALKTPCIVNNNTAATEFITSNTGVIYKNKEELYDIIQKFDNYNFNFRNIDCNKYSYDVYLKKVMGFYNEILERENKNE